MMRNWVVATLVLVMSSPLAAGSHSDGDYDQPVWFQWNRTTLETLIIPPGHGQLLNGNGVLNGLDPAELTACGNSYTRAMNESAHDWVQAINTYAPTWLKNGVTIKINVLGCDPLPPPAMVTGVDIIVATQEDQGVILGVTFNTRPCLIFNSMAFLQSFTYNDMYSVSGHEFGHCLGLQHVNDEHPNQDILDATYDSPIGSPANGKACASNLNVDTLRGVFAAVLGQAGAGVAGSVTTGAYAQIAC